VWNRAKLVAKDDDPHRLERLARLRLQSENVPPHALRVCADARAIHLRPKVGAAWMPQGTQEEVMPPGKNEPHSLAGARHLATGKRLYGLGPRKHHGWFRALLTLLATPYPAPGVTRREVVAENSGMHKAKAVEQWFATHPRLTRRWLPPYGPRAHPMERALGAVHDKCTRNPTRKRVRDVVQDVERPVQANGPWQTSSPSSIKTQRARRRSSTWLLRTKPRSPRECTNLMWADLECSRYGSRPTLDR